MTEESVPNCWTRWLVRQRRYDNNQGGDARRDMRLNHGQGCTEPYYADYLDDIDGAPENSETRKTFVGSYWKGSGKYLYNPHQGVRSEYLSEKFTSNDWLACESNLQQLCPGWDLKLEWDKISKSFNQTLIGAMAFFIICCVIAIPFFFFYVPVAAVLLGLGFIVGVGVPFFLTIRNKMRFRLQKWYRHQYLVSAVGTLHKKLQARYPEIEFRHGKMFGWFAFEVDARHVHIDDTHNIPGQGQDFDTKNLISGQRDLKTQPEGWCEVPYGYPDNYHSMTEKEKMDIYRQIKDEGWDFKKKRPYVEAKIDEELGNQNYQEKEAAPNQNKIELSDH